MAIVKLVTPIRSTEGENSNSQNAQKQDEVEANDEGIFSDSNSSLESIALTDEPIMIDASNIFILEVSW